MTRTIQTIVLAFFGIKVMATPDIQRLAFEDQLCQNLIARTIQPIGVCERLTETEWVLQTYGIHPLTASESLVPVVTTSVWKDETCTEPMVEIEAKHQPLERCVAYDGGSSVLTVAPTVVGFERVVWGPWMLIALGSLVLPLATITLCVSALRKMKRSAAATTEGEYVELKGEPVETKGGKPIILHSETP